jgi:hypothetical protein
MKYKITDKEMSVNYYIRYMLSRTQTMFEYKNLPDSIPQKMLELYLQMEGSCIITEHEGKLYAFCGGMGGVLDEYYRPTICTVANPALRLTKTYTINKDCVICYSDSLGIGLYPIYSKYAQLLTENDITMRMADINIRISDIISAPDDRTKVAAETYLLQIESGSKLGVIAETPFFDGIRVQPAATASGQKTLTQLIELQQYLKASLYNEIGLQSNYNMKRETLNSSETETNVDALLPLSDDMINSRRLFIEQVNAMYNQTISVDFSSAWKFRRDELEKLADESETENSGQPEKEPEESMEKDNDIK